MLFHNSNSFTTVCDERKGWHKFTTLAAKRYLLHYFEESDELFGSIIKSCQPGVYHRSTALSLPNDDLRLRPDGIDDSMTTPSASSLGT